MNHRTEYFSIAVELLECEVKRLMQQSLDWELAEICNRRFGLEKVKESSWRVFYPFMGKEMRLSRNSDVRALFAKFKAEEYAAAAGSAMV